MCLRSLAAASNAVAISLLIFGCSTVTEPVIHRTYNITYYRDSVVVDSIDSYWIIDPVIEKGTK